MPVQSAGSLPVTAMVRRMLSVPSMATQFHLLSFEGPDDYCRAGGVASRVSGLARTLADLGYATHLWFVGDPRLPGHEQVGELRLHRWCQWISAYHASGVYAGEDDKRSDYSTSLPDFMLRHGLVRHLERGGQAVIIAEEWHTSEAVANLDVMLRVAGVRDRVALLWNANNTFGFDRIDWPRLGAACTITTVSRYMRHVMWPLGLDVLVVPNGLDAAALREADPAAVAELHVRLRGRAPFVKVARWDPCKRWIYAVDAIAAMKVAGDIAPVLLARGGVEPYERDVLARAAEVGLRVVERDVRGPGVRPLLDALEGTRDADMVVFRSCIDPDARRVVLAGADAVLANSAHEPFGLVGLETMAARGVACTGGTGEDYAIAGQNGLVLETDDPGALVAGYRQLREQPERERELRAAARATAELYDWRRVVDRVLVPRVQALLPRDRAPAAWEAAP